MPYEIGKVFSDAVLGSIDRARDREAAHPGMVRREKRPRDSALDVAMLRAAQDERENKTRRELGLAELGVTRDRYSREADLAAGDLSRKRDADLALQGYREADLGRKYAADEMDAAYKGGVLDIREREASARAGRYADRGIYENGVLAVRQKEAEADALRAQVAQETAALRAQAENVRDVQGAQRLLIQARDLATRPGPDGKVNPERAAVFVSVIRDIEAMLRDPAGKNLPGDVSDAARRTRAEVGARSGIGGLDGDGDVDPTLDLALDGADEDLPPRLGR